MALYKLTGTEDRYSVGFLTLSESLGKRPKLRDVCVKIKSYNCLQLPSSYQALGYSNLFIFNF